MFLAFGVRGFIIFPSIHSETNELYNDEILRLSLERFPHVLIDRNLPHLISSSVVSDNKAAAREVIESLFLENHTEILLFIQRDTNSATHDRILGFEEGLMHFNKLIDKHLWFTALDKPGSFELDTALKAFISEHPNATAGIAIDTPLASAVYAILHKSGKRIPENFKLISFDDPRLPFVPYVKQNVALIAEKATRILISQMEDGYKVFSEKVPASFIRDVTYPLPFGIENL